MPLLRWLVAFAALSCAHLLLLDNALAQAGEVEAAEVEAGTAESGEVELLERELASELATLSAADCATACQSLESMMRAADRLCQLDPGPRCNEAQRTVDEAARRVRQACPECAAARNREDDDGTKTVTRAQETGQDGPTEVADESAPAAGPPAEERGAAGCAACTIGQGGAAPWTPWLLPIGLALAAARRRRR